MFIRIFFGFFLKQNKPGKKDNVILVVQSDTEDRGEQLFRVIHVNTELENRQDVSEIYKLHQKATPFEAQPIWTSIYEATKSGCWHQYT